MCQNYWFLRCFIAIPDFLLEAIWIRLGGQPAAQGIPKVSVLYGRVDQEYKKVPFRADETSAEDSRPRLKFAGPPKNVISRRRDAISFRLDNSKQIPQRLLEEPATSPGIDFPWFFEGSKS